MLEGSALTWVQVGGIAAGTLVVDIVAGVAMKRFFDRAERGDADRIASLRQVSRTANRTVLVIISGLLMLDTAGINIAALVAALGVIGLAISFGAQPLIKDIIGYVSFVFGDNFRAGENVSMDGRRCEVLKFELRGVVLRIVDDTSEWLAYVPYSKIGTVRTSIGTSPTPERRGSEDRVENDRHHVGQRSLTFLGAELFAGDHVVAH